MLTVDRNGDAILDFHRCAMLPAQNSKAMETAGLVEIPERGFVVADLDRATGRSTVPAPSVRPATIIREPGAGDDHRDRGGDAVSNAPELARLTLNMAAVHHDRLAVPGGERLRLWRPHHRSGADAAHSGLSSIATIVPGTAAIISRPSMKGTRHSSVTLDRLEPRTAGGGFVHFRCKVTSVDGSGRRTDVLDWRPVGLLP